MRKYIPHALIGVLLIFIVYQCESSKEERRLSDSNLDALTDTIRHYKNRIGTQSASIKTLQVDKSQLEKYILEKDKELEALAKEFSNIKQVIKYETVTEFDTIKIAYSDPAPCNFEFSDTKTAEWYSFNWKSSQQGIEIDNFKTWTSVTVITGTKRKWFLGNETVTTDITYSNPNITVTDIKAAEVIIPEPWYKKWYLWLAAGIGAGFLMSN